MGHDTYGLGRLDDDVVLTYLMLVDVCSSLEAWRHLL